MLIEKTSLAEYVNNSQEPTLQKLKSKGIVKDSVSTKQKKGEIEKDREEKWRRKTLHGKWPETLNKLSSKTSRWLQTAQLKPPTGAIIMAAQDQAINTNWYSHHILKNSPSDKCRLCNEHPETIEHITTGCPKLAQTIYMGSHRKNRLIASMKPTYSIASPQLLNVKQLLNEVYGDTHSLTIIKAYMCHLAPVSSKVVTVLPFTVILSSLALPISLAQGSGFKNCVDLLLSIVFLAIFLPPILVDLEVVGDCPSHHYCERASFPYPSSQMKGSPG